MSYIIIFISGGPVVPDALLLVDGVDFLLLANGVDHLLIIT